MSDERRQIMPKKSQPVLPSPYSVFLIRMLVAVIILVAIGLSAFGVNKVIQNGIPFIGQQDEIDAESSISPEDIDAYILDSYYLMREYIADRDTEDLHAAIAYPAMVVVLTDGKGQCQDALVATIGDEVRFHMEPLSAPYAC